MYFKGATLRLNLNFLFPILFEQSLFSITKITYLLTCALVLFINILVESVMILILEAASNRQGYVSLNIMVFLLELVDLLVVQQTLVFGITIIARTTRLNMNILMF